MGIMQNKVTRRIALGSIVGGLAGTALVLRSLKGRYNITVPHDNKEYVTDWGKYVKMVDVGIKEIEGPATFTLNYQPQIGTGFRVVGIRASYSDAESAKYPQPPRCYTFAEGSAAVIPAVMNDSPALLISTDKQGAQGRTFGEKRTAGKYILVPRRGGVDYFQVDRGAPQRVPSASVAIACAELGSLLWFDYPQQKTLSEGFKWITSRTSDNALELACEVVGFAEVAGRQAAKISAGPTKALDEMGATYHIVCYVDLKTGLPVRQEWRRVVCKPNGTPFRDVAVVIGQVLESFNVI
jgi:hypothetical protein